MGDNYSNSNYNSTGYGKTYSDGRNRCKRCNKPISDPTKTYGPYCEWLLGLSSRNSLSDVLPDGAGTGVKTVLDNTPTVGYTGNVLKTAYSNGLAYTQNSDETVQKLYDAYTKYLDLSESDTALYKALLDKYSSDTPTVAMADTDKPFYTSRADNYCGTGFKSFNDFYNYTTSNPEAAQDMLYKLDRVNESALKQIINDYVWYQGGVQRGNSNVYQVLYAAPRGENVKNNRYPDLPEYDQRKYFPSDRDMYDNERFTFFKAVNWLLQSGGRGNFALQTRITKDDREAAEGQIEIIDCFIKATEALQSIGAISKNTRPQLYIGSTEFDGYTAKEIYQQVMSDNVVKGNEDIIGGIYYGKEDYDKLEDAKKNMQDVSQFIHNKGKKMIWIPYLNKDDYQKSLEDICDIAKAQDGSGKGYPLIDDIMIQPSKFYYNYSSKHDLMEMILDEIKQFSSKREFDEARLGIEMEVDMGVVTGRRINDEKMDYLKKRQIFNEYLNAFDEVKDMDIPIGVYSGGPNEHGYDDIRNNHRSHNSGNYNPYWEGIDESAYKYGVHYDEFPYRYEGGNAMYDVNNYFYNGIWSDALTDSLWLDKRKGD